MQKIILGLKNLDKNTYKIIKSGLIFSTIICLISVLILLTYIIGGELLFYYLGITLVKTSFIFAVEFIICGIIVDFIRKHDI